MTSAAAVPPAEVFRGDAAWPHERPLTERVLGKLPGPRLGWMLAWGLLPFAAYEIAYLSSPWPSYQGWASNLTFGLVNVLGLWAVTRLGGRVAGLQSTLTRLLPAEDLAPRRHPFRQVGSLAGPIAISASLTLTWEVFDFVRYPSLAMGLLTVVVFVGQFGVATFLWVYGAALFGLDRVGRRQLRYESFLTDPSLGLRGLGSLAFESFLLAGAMSAPILVMAASDPRGFASGLVALAVISGLFFLSAHSLHRRLAEAKAVRLRWARHVVAMALDPVLELGRESERPTATVAALDTAAPRVAVAGEVERRAMAIQEWPFDAAIVRSLVAVLTSATAAIAARLLLSRFGM